MLMNRCLFSVCGGRTCTRTAVLVVSVRYDSSTVLMSPPKPTQAGAELEAIFLLVSNAIWFSYVEC